MLGELQAILQQISTWQYLVPLLVATLLLRWLWEQRRRGNGAPRRG